MLSFNPSFERSVPPPTPAPRAALPSPPLLARGISADDMPWWSRLEATSHVPFHIGRSPARKLQGRRHGNPRRLFQKGFDLLAVPAATHGLDLLGKAGTTHESTTREGRPIRRLPTRAPGARKFDGRPGGLVSQSGAEVSTLGGEVEQTHGAGAKRVRRASVETPRRPAKRIKGDDRGAGGAGPKGDIRISVTGGGDSSTAALAPTIAGTCGKSFVSRLPKAPSAGLGVEPSLLDKVESVGSTKTHSNLPRIALPTTSNASRLPVSVKRNTNSTRSSNVVNSIKSNGSRSLATPSLVKTRLPSSASTARELRKYRPLRVARRWDDSAIPANTSGPTTITKGVKSRLASDPIKHGGSLHAECKHALWKRGKI